MSTVFECEIQARLRDVNLGGHVDNVEAIRVLDEARLLFLHHGWGPIDTAAGGRSPSALFREVPSGVVELVGAQRVEYHAEMRFVPFQPFLVRMWVHHIGGSSFTLDSELRVAPDHPPALVAETTIVLWDTAAGRSWTIDETVRATLAAHQGPPITLRDRPGAAH